jgi:hypothetical protein
VVTAEGVLETVAVSTVAKVSAAGHTWARPVASVDNRSWAGEFLRTMQEVTPRAITSAAPETGAGARGFSSDDATTTTDRLAPICETALTAEMVNGPEMPPTRGPMSAQSRQELSAFISTTAVLPKTNRVYEKEWVTFKAFVKTVIGSHDPFLTNCTDDEEARGWKERKSCHGVHCGGASDVCENDAVWLLSTLPS